ncbi:hypothetical protein AB3M83_11100 [Microbacterium sp. 179-B 1A2 NHS]|uniref:hypothetical protein n=1 Tax=Microbacterium sp. 179-B 1A2 NHS TaxID=3142383 RepID=UPI0039A01504
MTGRVRAGLSILAVVFTAYLAIGGMVWTGRVDMPAIFVAALVLYLVTTWLCIFWEAAPRTRRGGEAVLQRSAPLPVWACVFALAATAVIPSATWYSVAEAARLESFATWTLGGVGALLTIVMVRRRPLVAWAGVVMLAAASSAWIGPVNALTLGAVGAAVWVGTAQLLTGLVDRAALDTAELTEIERRSSEWLASQEGRRRERRVRVQQALALAGPVLTRTIESDGRLSAAERDEARLAEGALRDELRGPRLLDESVRAKLHEARRRGSIVTVLDEGGLDGVSEEALERIRGHLARALEGAASDRIYIRTSPHESTAVTVVGRSHPGDDPGDEEVVDLWHEIPHEPAAISDLDA